MPPHATPLEEEGYGHAPREVQPREVPSHPRGAQVEVDHHDDRAVVVIVVTITVLAAAGCRCRRRRFHRPSDEPLHVCVTCGLMHNIWRSPVRYSPRILVTAASPPPLPPATDANDQRSIDAARDLSSGSGVRRHLLLYNTANRPTHQFCSLRN